MRNIFIGFLLIFLDFNLNIGSSQIGLIPDFVGYIVMIKGLVEMAMESGQFIKVKPFASGMAVYTGILYVMDLFGISASLGALSYILGIASVIISLYISYSIVMGVREIEEKYSIFMNGDSLYSAWKILAILNILTFVLIIIPALAIICIIATFVIAILFLVAFNKSKNLYYEMRV
ncbi:MAG: hypothetical protein GX285_09975 [Clostridiales bacterium]|nr:hypothetical protein [Clostridiales bacterium]